MAMRPKALCYGLSPNQGAQIEVPTQAEFCLLRAQMQQGYPLPPTLVHKKDWNIVDWVNYYINNYWMLYLKTMKHFSPRTITPAHPEILPARKNPLDLDFQGDVQNKLVLILYG